MNIRTRAALLLFGGLVLLSIGGAHAQSRGFGVGIILGEPTGVSFKGWVSQENAIDGGLAWAFGKGGRFHLHADYLWHFNLNMAAGEDFRFYTGIGGRFAAGSDAIFGARIPLGLVWLPKGAPLDVFVEIVPILDLAPATKFRGNGGIGARFFFP